MIGLDQIFSLFVCATTIIATLRAGSRALYLIDHDAIGVMDGPIIEPPTSSNDKNNNDNDENNALSDDETSLWELSQLFRHGVRLALGPTMYGPINIADTTTIISPYLTKEPYSLSPYPKPKRYSTIRNSNVQTTTRGGGGGASYNDEIIVNDDHNESIINEIDNDEYTKNMFEIESQSETESFNSPVTQIENDNTETNKTSAETNNNFGSNHVVVDDDDDDDNLPSDKIEQDFDHFNDDDDDDDSDQNDVLEDSDDDDDDDDEEVEENDEYSSDISNKSQDESTWSFTLSKKDSDSENYTRFLKVTQQTLVHIFQNWNAKRKASKSSTHKRKRNPFATKKTDNKSWDYHKCYTTEFRYNTTATNKKITKIAAHAPSTFADLRNCFGIPEEKYISSIFDGPFISFQSNSKGTARAGGVFFFTRDGAYMIKTIKKEEVKAFQKMLPKYHAHMKRHGRRSLLTRFCGMYTVQIQNIKGYDRGSSSPSVTTTTNPQHQYTFVVMNSVFPAEASTFISERYDLKGSTVGREASAEEKKSKGSNTVLKDLDLAKEVALVRSLGSSSLSSSKNKISPLGNKAIAEYGFHIGPTAKAALLSQLRQDVKLLVECQVMDYSLLVGVVNLDIVPPQQNGQRNKNHQQFVLDLQSLRAMIVSEHLQNQLNNAKQKLLKNINHHREPKLDEITLQTLATPAKLLISPALYIAQKAFRLTQKTISTILTLPLPYYGAGKCGVDGGMLSLIHGKRRGDRAIYYIGLIDFLQPWTKRKVVERYAKGLMGYDVHAISCVDPEEYAARFLSFIDDHVS